MMNSILEELDAAIFRSIKAKNTAGVHQLGFSMQVGLKRVNLSPLTNSIYNI